MNHTYIVWEKVGRNRYRPHYFDLEFTALGKCMLLEGKGIQSILSRVINEVGKHLTCGQS